MVAASMAPDHRRAPPLPAGVPGLAPPSRPLHRPSAASYGMSHPPPLRATPPPLPPPQPLPRSQETFRGDHRSLGGGLSTLGGDPRLSLPAPARRGRTSCAVPAPREANSTPGPHQLCCAGPTGTPARQGRTSCAVQAPQEPPHARAAPAVLCRPHRNPRTQGPHQLCCAGPTGSEQHARAAPAVLCRPHRNPRTPGPHQLCCAGPTGTPARQGRTSCAVQAPQEPPHARAAPAVLCRPHRNPRTPGRKPHTPGPHQLCCAGPTGNGQRPSTPALVRFRGTQADCPLPCRGGAAAGSKGNRGPAGPRTGGPSSQPPQPASVSHRSGHPPPRSGGGLQGNTHRWLLPPPCARTPPPSVVVGTRPA